MAFFKFLGTLATIVATVLVVGFFLTMVPKGSPSVSPSIRNTDAQACSTRDRHSATPTLDSLTCDPSR
jgi:hypothetical protein